MPTLVRPRIERRTPADLVTAARAGELRVPGFQRLYRWTPSDVVALFDSMYKGYPIGNLLLWQRSAEAARVTLGPLEIDAPAVARCHWVVDGQQRITSIVGALTAPEGVSDPRFRIYFDLESAEFRSVAVGAAVERAWLPVRAIATNQALLAWQRDNADWLTQEHFSLADAVASAIREYEVPSYVVESQDERVLREIFARLNTTGRQMTEVEVFQALWSAGGHAEPHDLRSLADIVAGWGFGRLADEELLDFLRYLQDRYEDPSDAYEPCDDAWTGHSKARTQHVWKEFPDDAAFASTLRSGEHALRVTFDFLRGPGGIPHLRLLPIPSSAWVVGRFVHEYGPPRPDVARLLRRWLWRNSYLPDHNFLTFTVPRDLAPFHAADARTGAQQLLAYHRDLLLPWRGRRVTLRDVDFGREPDVRVNVLGMVSLGPVDLTTGQPCAVSQLLDAGDPLIRPVEATDAGLENCLVHGPTDRPLRDLLLDATPRQLASHGVTAAARERLAAGDVDGFLASRADVLKRVIADHIDRMAEWGARDDVRARDLMRLGG